MARDTIKRSGGSRRRAADPAPQRERDEEVLRVAAEVFARNGYAAASVQDVADELGILKGSLYHYIKTKEDLLFRLLEEIHTEVDQLLKEIQAEKDLGPVERLAEYIRRQAAYNLRNHVRISVYYNDLEHLTDERLQQIVRHRRTHERFVETCLREAQEAKEITSVQDPKILTNMVFAIIIWPYRWFNPRGRASVDSIAASCVDFALNGIGAT